MAAITVARVISTATGGFRLRATSAAARRAVTQNILERAVSLGADLAGVGEVERLFRRAGLGIRSSDFIRIYRGVVGRQASTPQQRRVLQRQSTTPLDRVPNLRDIPTIRQTGVSRFVIRVQVETIDPNTGRTSRSWISINSDTRLTRQDVIDSIPDFGFESGSEQNLQRGTVSEIVHYKRSPTTTIEV